MARITKNHMLEISAAVLVIGIVLTFLSWAWKFGDGPTWLTWYGNRVTVNGQDFNLYLVLLAPLVLLGGAFYFGEQIVLRRRFERLLDTPKKSEFLTNKKDLVELSRRLPDEFSDKIDMKESEFKSKRAV
ncbi:MAG: hypothetical protein ACYDCK_06980 [Thermoplasmatota archaeon]